MSKTIKFLTYSILIIFFIWVLLAIILASFGLETKRFNPLIIEQVKKLADVAKEKRIGVVCSGQEAKIVRKIIGSELLIFTPGIRMNNDNQDDYPDGPRKKDEWS